MSPEESNDETAAAAIDAAHRASVERARAAAASREGEQKYQALFAASPVPCFVLSPEPPDFTFLAANDAYLAATRKTRADLIGRKVFDVFTDDPGRPDAEGPNQLRASLARVLESKRPDALPRTRYDIPHPDGGFEERWWLAISAPVFDASGRISAIIHQVTDATEQHFAEVAVQEHQARQAFLLKLSDALRPLDDPLAIQQAAMRMLGKRLDATRAFYFLAEPAADGNWIHVVETDYRRDPGVPSHVGRYSVRDYGSDLFEGMERGKILVVSDVTRTPGLTAAQVQGYRAIDIAAFVLVPLIRNGKFVAGIGAHDSLPHHWRPEDLTLMQEVAARIWASVEYARAEEALRESEEQFRSLAAATSDTVYKMSADWSEMRYLRGKQFLADTQDPSGTWPERYIPPEDHPPVLAAIQEAIRDKRPFELEHRVIRSDGTVGWTFSRAIPLLDPRGGISGWLGTASDMTERKRAEETLRHSEEWLRTLADAVPQLIWTNTGEGAANYFNKRWYEYSGLSFEQSYGLGWQAIMHPDNAPRSVPAWEAALAAGEVFDTEYRLRRADREYRWFIGRNVPLKDEAGRVLGWFGSATDIHDLKLAEQETGRARAQAEAAQARAEAAGAAKDHFLAVLSHELRTPLMPITMALALLAKRSDLPEAVTSMFAMIKRNVELEKGFIDDLLDVTRIERGKMEITRAPMDLFHAIERAVEIFAPDIQSKGQRLTVSLEGTGCPYHGDCARLQQVFWNLLKNASKFTPPGGAIEVRSLCRAGDQFVVEVADTGIGLEADAIERIFRPFEQASTSITREFGGLGLGLAIAKATVDAHGGTLRVRSPGLGQGATFTVSLPSTATSLGKSVAETA